MKLIAGLGNPGRNYANNRHNTGFRFINYLSQKYSIEVNRNQCQSRVGTGIIAGEQVVLTKPRTYVNNSGLAVSSLIQKYNIALSDLVVVYDDMDLPLGKIRIRPGGASGGHKGLKSIISEVGSLDFCRIKIGIGRPIPGPKRDLTDDVVVNYVLSDFSLDEETTINTSIAAAAEALELLISEGVVAAMNKFN